MPAMITFIVQWAKVRVNAVLIHLFKGVLVLNTCHTALKLREELDELLELEFENRHPFDK